MHRTHKAAHASVCMGCLPTVRRKLQCDLTSTTIKLSTLLYTVKIKLLKFYVAGYVKPIKGDYLMHDCELQMYVWLLQYNDTKLCQIEIVNIMCVCVMCVYNIERIYNVLVAMRQWWFN